MPLGSFFTTYLLKQQVLKTQHSFQYPQFIYLFSHVVTQQTLWSGNAVPSDQQNRSGKRVKACIAHTENYRACSLLRPEKKSILFLFDSSLSTTPENLCNNSGLAGGQQATFPEHSKIHKLLLLYLMTGTQAIFKEWKEWILPSGSFHCPTIMWRRDSHFSTEATI